MTATDELRRMLDERGVEWTVNDGEYVKDVKETCWPDMGELMAAFAEYYDGTTRFACDTWYTWCFIPEQEIEATLGAHRNLNTEGSYACPDCGCVVDYGTRGDGEKIVFMEDYVIPLNHCPNCGRRIEV